MRRLRPPTLRATEAPVEHARPSVATNSTGILAGAVSSAQMALTQESKFTGAGFTTTNTTDWQDVAEVSIQIPNASTALFYWCLSTPQHSAAAAEVSARVLFYVDDALSTAYGIGEAKNIYMATANKNISPIVMSMGLGSANFPLAIPGSRLLRFQVFNHTAGTLTLQSGGSSEITLHAFVAGDASQ